MRDSHNHWFISNLWWSSGSVAPAQSRVNQSRLLRVMCFKALIISKGGDFSTSPGNLFWCLINFTVKKSSIVCLFLNVYMGFPAFQFAITASCFSALHWKEKLHHLQWTPWSVYTLINLLFLSLFQAFLFEPSLFQAEQS